LNIKNLHIPIILVSIIVSVISSFGSFSDVIGFLTFLKPESTFNGYIGFISFGETFFVQNEWWRLVTPMLIHFSFAHLAFNCLWIYILGSKIELINGRMKFLLLVPSNFYWGKLNTIFLHRISFIWRIVWGDLWIVRLLHDY
jgi:GlpG protein